MATPQKSRNVDCFVCFGTEITTYKLYGRKLTNEDFQKSICTFIDITNYEKLIEHEAGVCRNCYSQISKCKAFVDKLKHSCSSYVNSTCRTSKRCARSPITPKAVNFKNPSLDSVIKHSSRKQLKLMKETVTSPSLSNSHNKKQDPEPECIETPDHLYSKQLPTIEKEENNDIYQLIRESVSVTTNDEGQNSILNNIRNQAATLTSRTTMLASVLYKYREISNLADNAENLLVDIIKEMQERIPFLFNVLCCVAIPATGKISEGIIPVLASCYSILMKHRYHNLSAFHRLTTAIVTKGGLDERPQHQSSN